MLRLLTRCSPTRGHVQGSKGHGGACFCHAIGCHDLCAGEQHAQGDLQAPGQLPAAQQNHPDTWVGRMGPHALPGVLRPRQTDLGSCLTHADNHGWDTDEAGDAMLLYEGQHVCCIDGWLENLRPRQFSASEHRTATECCTLPASLSSPLRVTICIPMIYTRAALLQYVGESHQVLTLQAALYRL